jgi:hypothetical protein
MTLRYIMIAYAIIIPFHHAKNIPYYLYVIPFPPENSLVLMETNLPTPTTARVYVNLPESNNQ